MSWKMDDKVRKFKVIDPFTTVKKFGTRNNPTGMTDIHIRDSNPIYNLEFLTIKCENTTKYLRRKRKEYKELIRELDGEYKIFEECENAFVKQFKKYDNFVQLNKEKQKRLKERSRVEEANFKKYSALVDILTVQCDKMAEVKEKLENQLQRHKVYELFFKKVAKMYGMNNIEIMHRFYLLLQLRKEHDDLCYNRHLEIIKVKQELKKYVEQRRNEIMGLNYIMSTTIEKHARIKHKIIEWENLIQDILSYTTERESLYCGTKMQLGTLFEHVVNTSFDKSKVASAEQTYIEEARVNIATQLDIIKLQLLIRSQAIKLLKTVRSSIRKSTASILG
ncbi:uncharacterized protein LOC109599862 [Aethina tumida]|uniref:uncharacterized protein LOC109599862 n=1 Tax=Aethina tumida TaxID=116153 RepID=UPI00096B3EDE|nr:uncharacterized protein LOC109599862 [Aethina tumida]